MYSNSLGLVADIGTVRIGEFNMGESQFSPNIPEEFDRLNMDKFFSIGTEDYYNKIASMPNEIGYDILVALNDFTVYPDLYEKAKNEKVTQLSLLRDISKIEQTKYINKLLDILKPPVNLSTMRRIYGSTGWDDVDHGLIEMQRLLNNANTQFYYNAIATIGREIIMMVTNRVYNDDIHRDKVKYTTPPDDGKYANKLHSYIDYLYGEADISKDLKNYIKSTINLVNGYVHKENAEGYESFMCVHSVIALVYQISLLCRRDKYNRDNIKT
jgi:hypothetical protein